MKKLVFKTEVRSPIHGTFRVGDTPEGVDPVWAEQMVKAGHAEYTTATHAAEIAEAAQKAESKKAKQ